MKKLLKMLPDSWVSLLRNLVQTAQKQLALILSKNGFLSSVYYTFFSTRFYREHQSVLRATLEFEASKQQEKESSSFIRRSVHRIEKGLIMMPRRDVFGEGYIYETVFALAQSHATLEPGEKKWARDVLLEYFSAVNETPPVTKAKQLFDSLALGEDNVDTRFVPYQRRSAVKSDVSYDQLRALCQQRRSVRWFKEKPVPREAIYQAIDVASLAPSACNRQPFSFHVCFEGEVAKELGKLPMGASGFSHNFNTLIAVVGDLSYYAYERDRHVIYIDSSLAAMQFMLALETLGLSSCVLNWPDVELLEQRASKRLNLESWQRPTMFIAVGYADDDGLIPYSQKKSASLLATEVL